MFTIEVYKTFAWLFFLYFSVSNENASIHFFKIAQIFLSIQMILSTQNWAFHQFVKENMHTWICNITDCKIHAPPSSKKKHELLLLAAFACVLLLAAFAYVLRNSCCICCNAATFFHVRNKCSNPHQKKEKNVNFCLVAAFAWTFLVAAFVAYMQTHAKKLLHCNKCSNYYAKHTQMQ